jgi:two-component system chemotaxis response regulator CheB
VLGRLDRRCPGIVVVQHMPQRFTRSFAERLHRLSGAEVKEAEHLDMVLPGRVLIAPGGKHLVCGGTACSTMWKHWMARW